MRHYKIEQKKDGLFYVKRKVMLIYWKNLCWNHWALVDSFKTEKAAGENLKKFHKAMYHYENELPIIKYVFYKS